MLPVYLISYNRLTWLKGMVDYLIRIPSVLPIILDNKSTYSPLLEWYSTSPVEVIRLSQNFGHLCAWTSGVLPMGADHQSRYGQPYYAVSDPDLDLSKCPTDLFDVLKDGLRRHPRAVKAGVSLEIDDIPDHNPLKSSVIAHESAFWSQRADESFWWAGVDTVLAIYDCGRAYGTCDWINPSLRADRPYTARHLPWYTDPENMTKEERKYLAGSKLGHWSSVMRASLPNRCASRNIVKFL